MRKSLSRLSTRLFLSSLCLPWHHREEWSIKLSRHLYHYIIQGLSKSHQLYFPARSHTLEEHYNSNQLQPHVCVFSCLIPIDKKAVGQGVEDWKRWTSASRRNLWWCWQPFLLCLLVLRQSHSCLPCWPLCRGAKAHPSCTLLASAPSTQHSLSLDRRQLFLYSAQSQAGNS